MHLLYHMILNLSTDFYIIIYFDEKIKTGREPKCL